MKKKLIKGYSIALYTVGVLFIGYLIGCNNKEVNDYRNTLNQHREATDAYVWACERLLDIIVENDSDFCDTISETDEYSDYINAKGLVYEPLEEPEYFKQFNRK